MQIHRCNPIPESASFECGNPATSISACSPGDSSEFSEHSLVYSRPAPSETPSKGYLCTFLAAYSFVSIKGEASLGVACKLAARSPLANTSHLPHVASLCGS